MIQFLNKGSSSGVKLFKTKEAMAADTSAKEGDLAIVYKNEINNMTANTQTQFITFPETVTLLEAFEDSTYIRLIATDSQVMFEGNVQLAKTSFRFDGFSDIGMLSVTYISSDGITYTRDRFSGNEGDLTNPVDLGTMVHCEMPEEWNEALGYFMQVGGSTFEGLYQANNIINGYKYPLLNLNSISVTDYIEIPEEILNLNADAIIPTQVTDHKLISGRIYMGISNFYKFTDYDWVMSTSRDTVSYYDYTSNVLSEKQTDTLNMQICGNRSNTTKYYSVTPDGYTTVSEIIILRSTTSMGYDYATDTSGCPFIPGKEYGTSGVEPTFRVSDYPAQPIYKVEYQLAPTQLTAIKNNVYNSIYYGKDGVKEGTLTQNVSNSFTDINAEVYIKLKNIYDNMSPKVLSDDNYRQDQNIQFVPINNQGQTLLDTSALTTMSNIFYNCTKLTYIPSLNTSNVTDMTFAFNGCTNLISGPEMDTSNVTKMNYMFAYDTNLINIPVYDASSVKTMSNMFYQCPNLSDDSLNNIMQMCISTTDLYTGNKTLSALSISSEQATKCTTLSNYEAFTAARWTTGY